MKFSSILHLVLLSGASVLSAAVPVLEQREPTPTAHTVTAVKRQNAVGTCGANVYQIADQTNAFNAATAQDNAGTTIRAPDGKGRAGKGRKYPEPFNNRENVAFPLCAGVTTPLREFPILAGGVAFSSSTPQDTDRVVYTQTGTDSTGAPTWQYCGLMTHTGAPKRNDFVACT